MGSFAGRKASQSTELPWRGGRRGVLTVVPALEVLGIGFRLGELVWGVVWPGIVWFRGSRSAAARKLRTFFAVRFGKRVATTQDLTPTRGES